METLLIQIVLWIGLVFIFWVLRENLSGVESDIESEALPGSEMTPLVKSSPFDHAEQLMDAIGTYMENPIYRYAIINGIRCRFAHVMPSGGIPLESGQRCLAPGLVYVRDQPGADGSI